jgi:hypothetical protein
MIEKHIVNIGQARAGTSWLWKCANFNPAYGKENNILRESLDFDQYIKYYNQYQVSANFQVSLWQVDREIIQFVQKHASHITFIVRNPFDFVERYFDFIYQEQDKKTLTQYLVSTGYVNYRDIVDRWAIGAKKFKIFFFEDLANNPKIFFKEYMAFCQLPIAKTDAFNYNTIVHANPKQEKIKLEFTNDQIDFINHEIDQFQSIVDKDLTHWKK